MVNPLDQRITNAVGEIIRTVAEIQARHDARLNEKRVECDEMNDRLIEARALRYAAEERYAALVEVVSTRTAQVCEPTVPKSGHCGGKDKATGETCRCDSAKNINEEE